MRTLSFRFRDRTTRSLIILLCFLSTLIYAVNASVAASGGFGIELLSPNNAAIEASGLPARWVIRITGNHPRKITELTFKLAFSAQAGELFDAASPADYVLRDKHGTIVPDEVTLPIPGDYEIFLHPIDDGRHEAREDLTLTLDAGVHKIVGNPLSVSIFDQTNYAVDKTLFIATLVPERSARTTTASGLATIVLNGNHTAAKVTCHFNGLTSVQSAAHLHYASSSNPQQGQGPPIFSLPLGEFDDLEWEIRATQGYSVGDIIDALYQQNGLNIYLNVHTARHASGEIRGAFVAGQGSTSFEPPADPPPLEPLTGDELRRDVARFLIQATFGPDRETIDHLTDQIVNEHGGDRIAGFNAWIDEQLRLDQTSLDTLLYYLDESMFFKAGLPRGGEDEFSGAGQTPHWVHWDVALHAHDQLRQRVAFALSEIVVISKVGNNTIDYVHGAAETYWDMLADHADGTYYDVLYDVSKSPVMGSYLSHLANQKEKRDPVTDEVLFSPDENYAREIMQLFSIGLLELHPDGSLKLDDEGNVLETYSNDDITELARIFTGWGLSKNQGGGENNNFFRTGRGRRFDNQRWIHPMKSFAAYHDTGSKRVLGHTIAGGLDGEGDFRAALAILYQHPNIGPFIAQRLIQRLVTSNPSRGYIYRVASVFNDNGRGVKGDIAAVVTAILLDYEARSLTFVDLAQNKTYGKVKEPLIAFIQFCRAFHVSPDRTSTDPISDLVYVGYPQTQADNFPANWAVIGITGRSSSFGYGFNYQHTFMSAPTVFNYYQPDYTPGGDLAASQLVAPELQIANDTTVPLRHIESWEKLNKVGRDWPVDLSQFQDIYDNAGFILRNRRLSEEEAAEVLVDHLDLVLTAGTLKADYADAAKPNPRSIIIETVAAQSDDLRTGKALTAPYLILVSPTFQVQR